MGHVKNYFVFVLMMVGVIDDFKSALASICDSLTITS